jgi:hypothetical protein
VFGCILAENPIKASHFIVSQIQSVDGSVLSFWIAKYIYVGKSCSQDS